MTDYRWARLRREDIPAWTALTNHLGRVDGTGEQYSAEDMAENFEAPLLDPERDTWTVWDGEDLVAVGSAQAVSTPDHEGNGRAFIEGGVHADHRNRGLGTRLVELATERAREMVDEHFPTGPAYLRAGGGLVDSSSQRLLEDHGFSVVRYFNELERPLTEAPEVTVPEGVVLRCPGPEDEVAVHRAHDEAFRDHWGSGPVSDEQWHRYWTSRTSRSGLSTIAVEEGRDGSGSEDVLAYVLVGQWMDREAYVTIVGTRAAARGRGVATAALNRTIALAVQDGGYDRIGLDVDSDSPTGATRLYERLGFGVKHTTTSMQRGLER